MNSVKNTAHNNKTWKYLRLSMPDNCVATQCKGILQTQTVMILQPMPLLIITSKICNLLANLGLCLKQLNRIAEKYATHQQPSGSGEKCIGPPLLYLFLHKYNSIVHFCRLQLPCNRKSIWPLCVRTVAPNSRLSIGNSVLLFNK